MPSKTASPKKAKPASWELQPRLRVRLKAEIALGPGKIELLEQVESTGSISEAASQLGMSYMRAWTLIRTMNNCFKEPVVFAARGGSKGGGGAVLTNTGKAALTLYRQLNAECLKATHKTWKELQSHLKN
jgi:molybdate transport system regulatory protein